MVGYVLGRFQEDERATLAQVIDRAADAVQHILKHGVESAMNLFNRK
jgi:PTH1 family peptidyl-tRNA hydrolase